jgi:two-component system, chemotaxis family, sensor kinase CheA
MDDLIADFIAETREMLAALAEEIVAWERAPADRSRLDAIFRFVHTVKGNSGFFDLPRIRALSHAAEDALSAVREGRREADGPLVSAVLAVIDRLGQLIEALESGSPEPGEGDEGLIAALEGRSGVDDAAPAAAAPPQPRGAVRSVRLPVELLDRMMSGVSDLVLVRNELSRRLREAGSNPELEGCFERVSALIADLRDSVTRTRMQRLEVLFSALPRMVRDLAAETGKPVELDLDGGDVELDREMIEMVRDPLSHIVRNAVDHGLEAPDRRRSAGKPQTGRLAVSARQSGNQIVIEIADDGAGIDGEALARKAVAAGLITAERASGLTEPQKIALVFEPGLSTAAKVTELSGRGVGMDVVRENIERVGGMVEIDSRAGRGARVMLRVPLTLTIIPALTLRASGQTFAVPRSAIEEIVRVRSGATRIESLAGSRVATLRGRRFPVVSLSRLMGLEAGSAGDETLILLKPARGGLYALAVDEVRDHEELVVKPASPAVMAAGLYAGTTLADDGRPVLVLDPPGIAVRAGLSLERGELAEPPVAPAAGADAAMPLCLLFRSLDGAHRLVEVAAVERIEEVGRDSIGVSAGRLHVTLGDSLLPLAGCGDALPDGVIRLLRLGDGAREIGYAVADVADVIRPASPVLPAASPGEIRGVTLHEGRQVEWLDLHWLFSTCGAPAAARREAPLCVLPDDDPFMQTILRPLIESAGYRVGGSAEAASADLFIVGAESGEIPPGRPVVRIRAEAEPGGEGDDSLHRYDRAGLLEALQAARKKA